MRRGSPHGERAKPVRRRVPNGYGARSVAAQSRRGLRYPLIQNRGQAIGVIGNDAIHFKVNELFHSQGIVYCPRY